MAGMNKKKRSGTVEPVGVKEIALRANVSLATVDRVLHNRSGVSEATREKIKQIIKELNYQPNILARVLASRKAYHFAVLIPKVSAETAFWQAPLQGIERAEAEISQYGIKIHKFFFDQNDKQSFVDEARGMLENKVDGIIVAPSFIDESIQFTNTLKQLKVPYVFINSDIPAQDSLCYIGPELFKSGYLAGNLASYGRIQDGKILVINISKEIDTDHHLLRKEEGFRKYFQEKGKVIDLMKVDIHQTEYQAVEESLSRLLAAHPDIAVIFVTNSRVSSVARYLEKTGGKDILLIGYDYLPDNIDYLRKEVINFLICQKPEEQGYRGVMALFQTLVLQTPVESVHHMPIDIVTRENYEFYRN
jgi:LacI family transcriptional regulator